VIEIQGPAASGKTEFLYHLAACCVLPKEVLIASASIHAGRTVPIGGWNKSVIVLDCDGRWNIRRLHDILFTRLNIAFSGANFPPNPNPPQNASSVAKDSLKHLHIFRPTSSFQLASTIVYLSKYHTEKMPNEEVGLLIVDSISSFYWSDRWQVESSSSKRRFNPIAPVLRALQTFRISHGPVVILSNWGLNPLPSGTTPTPFFRQHLPPPFPAPLDDSLRQAPLGQGNILPLTKHITLPFPFVAQLQLSEHSRAIDHLEEALSDLRRKEVVYKGLIKGYTRIPLTDSPTQQIARRSKCGIFNFRILEHDVSGAPGSIESSTEMVCTNKFYVWGILCTEILLFRTNETRPACL